MSAAGLCAAILAGGASRRMGTDKARLRVGGEALLERTARLAAEAGLPVLVVGRPRPADWGGSGAVRFLPDEVPGQGPLGGLQAALRAALSPAPLPALLSPPELAGAVLALPCDLPRLTSDAIAFLRDEARRRRPALGLYLSAGGEAEPLVAVYAAAALPLVEERLRAGQRSLQGLLRAAPFEALPAPDWLLPALHNANAPSDL